MFYALFFMYLETLLSLVAFKESRVCNPAQIRCYLPPYFIVFTVKVYIPLQYIYIFIYIYFHYSMWKKGNLCIQGYK